MGLPPMRLPSLLTLTALLCLSFTPTTVLAQSGLVAITEPLPNAVYVTTAVGIPLTCELSISLSYDESYISSAASAVGPLCSSPAATSSPLCLLGSSWSFSLMFELDKLDKSAPLSPSSPDSDFALLTSSPLPDPPPTFVSADLSRVPPGHRRIRVKLYGSRPVSSLTSSPPPGESVSLLFDMAFVDFRVVDHGSTEGRRLRLSRGDPDESESVDAAPSPDFLVGVDVDVDAHTSRTGVADYAEYFSQVYRYNVWSAHSPPGASSSGPGSNVESTVGVRSFLLEYLRDRNSSGNNNGVDRPPIKRIVDVPCGDMTWMSLLLPSLHSLGVEYVGYDVVPSVVARNRQRFADLYPSVRFEQADVTSLAAADADRLFSPGDLILCRHLMFHLPSESNLKVLESLSTSRASALLLTTYLRADDNEGRDFVLAMGHKVNLFREPYCVKDPTRMVRDDDFDLYLALWERGGGELRRPSIVQKGMCMKSKL